MLNDDQMVGKILSRREALRNAGRVGLMLAGGSLLERAAVALGLVQGPPIHLYATPTVTEGPFFVDERLNRSNLLADTQRASVLKGMPLRLRMSVYEQSPQGFCSPLANAMVDLWHVDSSGAYSDEPRGLNPENTRGEHWLRGYQTTDAKGEVAFDTIFPGWYRGRTVHIHFKVRLHPGTKQQRELTSQLFFPDALADKIFTREPYLPRPAYEMRNQSDMVYCDGQSDGSLAGEHLTLAPKPLTNSSGLEAHFAIAMVMHPHPSQGGRFVSV